MVFGQELHARRKSVCVRNRLTPALPGGANVLRALETSRPGVFAIGDVRSGSVKRVAASVGEGAQVVAALHAFLAAAGDRAALPANTGRD